MKASSLPNLNRETTSFPNFFTLFQDPSHHDDTTLNKRPNIDHNDDSEASETSPFKDVLSPLLSFNERNENHFPIDGSFYQWNQMDRTLPRWARNSVLRAQLTNDLMKQVAQLKKENNNIHTTISVTTQQFLYVEAENSILRAQMVELSQRLQSLNDIVSFLNTNNGGFVETQDFCGTYEDGFMNNSWNFMYLNQPIMASAADMFQY